jgi:hypothetical protein
MKLPKIFIIRFCPGAAGKIIASLLQTSNEIAVWDHELQSHKNTDKFEKHFLNYIDKKFPIDFSTHLLNEPDPILPMTDYYSASYSRGNSFTAEQFINWHKNDDYFKYLTENNLYLSFGLNKKEVPLFCANAKILNVSIDGLTAKKFLHRARYKKHFIVDNKKVIHLQHHPDHCPPYRKQNAIKFYSKNKPIKNIDNLVTFFKKEIINHEHVKRFECINNVISHQSNKNADNYIFSLSNFLNKDKAINEIKLSFEYFNLTGFNNDLVEKAYGI